MNGFTRQRLRSVVVLSVADRQLHVAHVARAKNAVAVLKTASATLSLDLLHPDEALVGREIRRHLDAAGVRERHCAVVLPPAWILTHHTQVPELSPEDTASLLALEAEKGFPVAPEELQIARSSQEVAGARYVTQFAVRQDPLARLEAVLKHAGLKPVSFCLGLPPGPDRAGAGLATLVLESRSAMLLISAGGGIAALRMLDATIDAEAGEAVLNGPALARELRITFEQLPPELRPQVRRLSLQGDERLCRQFPEYVRPWLDDAGVTLEAVPASRPIGERIVEEAGQRLLTRGGAALEFLPPRPSRWSALAARYSSRRLASAGFAAGAVVLAALAAFGWREYQLWSLRSEWQDMAPRVAELDAVQARIREFRPWHDTSFRHLTILKRVVECFPDNGSVTAKSFEIHGPATVTVTGTARDNAALLRTLDQLRQAREIQALKIDQIRGKTPVQFSFTFRWVGLSGT